MIKAKSTGISLVSHSIQVSEVAVKIAKTLGLQNELIETIRISALLHDIGKACKSFQNMLDNHDNEGKGKNKFRHNEIGWAFLKKNLIKNNKLGYRLDLVLDSVYWHHGITNKMNANYIDQIFKDISDADNDAMRSVAIELIGCDNILNDDDCMNNSCTKTPTYFYEQDDTDCGVNANRLIVRTCVVSSDRLVSSLGNNKITDETIDNFIISTLNKTEICDMSFDSSYNNDRYIKQKEISQNNNNTVIVKAPAGFGKTLVGLLWSIRSNKKLIWVCPRNVIAESVYTSILDELNKINLKCTVELYYENEVKKTNGHNSTGFDSNIIVTNIDNYLTPSFDVNNSHKMFQILNCDVVFDEYHEFQTQSALFACFVNIIDTRSNFIKDCRTMLLSATPTLMDFLWDNKIDKNTITLPNDIEHYKPAHNNKYTINVIQDDMENITPCDNSITIFNSIKNSQNCKRKLNNNQSILFHSNYEKNRKLEIIDNIYKNYGKNSFNIENKQPIIAAPIIQASLDISCKILNESVISPESTLQRIGRCNRWGDIDNSIINIYDSRKNKSEQACVSNFYNNELTSLWFNELKQLNNKQVTLEDIYNLYNTFNKTYTKKIKQHIKNTYNTSLSYLTDNVYPIKYNNTVRLNKNKTAGGNKLRSVGGEVFYIVKKANGSYTELFSKNVRSGNFDNEFNESYGNSNNFLKNMKNEIINVLQYDERYDFSELIKSIHNDKYKSVTLDEIRRHSKKSITPYIWMSGFYCDEYGVQK